MIARDYIFVRKGQLFLTTGMGSGERLLPVGPAASRPAAPDLNRERISFNSIVEGHAVRLFAPACPCVAWMSASSAASGDAKLIP
jgi:hypothetical protein